MANPMGKTRKVTEPYLIYENNSGWTWKVLKAHSADPNKPLARWFCDVSSPYTFGGSDLGDTYISDVLSGATRLTFRDPVVPDSAIPDPKKVAANPDPFEQLGF